MGLKRACILPSEIRQIPMHSRQSMFAWMKAIDRYLYLYLYITYLLAMLSTHRPHPVNVCTCTTCYMSNSYVSIDSYLTTASYSLCQENSVGSLISVYIINIRVTTDHNTRMYILHEAYLVSLVIALQNVWCFFWYTDIASQKLFHRSFMI